MEIDRTKCLYCGACVGTCPTLALLLEETRIRYFEEACTRCRACEIVCPVGAIDLNAPGDTGPLPATRTGRSAGGMA